MERKEVKPNIRTTSKKSSELTDNMVTQKPSPAHQKADEMESGFLKSRPSNPSPSKVLFQNQDKPTEKETQTYTAKATLSEENVSASQSILDPNAKNDMEVKPSTPKRARKKTEKKEADKEPASPTKTQSKNMSITLSYSACMMAFITLIVTLAFVFLFGLIIGKGMVPAPVKEAPEKLQAPLHVTEENNIVLPKEDLQFMTNLKKEPPKEEELQETDATPTHELEENLSDAIGDEGKDEILPSSRLYDFNLRVAAFRNAEQADTLRAKLEGDGFRTTLVTDKDKKGTWYFVHVLMRGTETRLKEARERFKKFAIRDSIIKEQTEVK